MTLRVGVIGGGLMGSLHAQTYTSLPGVELVGIVEPDPAQHDELRQSLGVPIRTDPAELWDDVDAVSVCTPETVRRDVILPAFDRGVRVLVEKPLAIDLAEARELLAARPDPSYLMVGHILRFDPRVQQARAVVRSGDLGDLWSGRVWRCGTTATGTKIGARTSVDWFLGIHDVDLVRFVTGREVTAVQAAAWTHLTERRDLVRARLTLDSGVPIEVEWSWTLPPERSSGLRAGLELVCSGGMLEVDLSHSAVAVTTGRSARQANLDTFHWPTVDGSPGGDLRGELASFVGTATAGTLPAVTGDDGMRAVAVLVAAEEAYGGTDSVPVPTHS